ncbi:MAG: apolipoprotein N-acyltransferase, partial [Alphaproteobacteria bacterium]|nr:apolipoprotein N-acyltransferase [Alphaproteobacteria bacterium]
VLAGGALAALALVAAGGAARLSGADAAVVDGVRLRLVQPAIPQAQKWVRDLRESHMLDQIDLGLAPPGAGDPAPTHVIWAETAAPFFIGDDSTWLRRVGAGTPAGGVTILGAPRLVTPPDAPGAPYEIANALLAIDPNGAVLDHFDKFHLVPFGEYVPLADWLPLDKITPGTVPFTPGPGPRALDLPGLPPVSPLICYEIIFPHAVVDAERRAQWILNLTNDGWYGKTAGPHQHFTAARLRAVEEGLPVARAAFTGISGMIDPYGRVTAQLGLGEKGFVDADLPRPAPNPGLYARLGNAVPVGLAVLVALGGLLGGFRGGARNRDRNRA